MSAHCARARGRADWGCGQMSAPARFVRFTTVVGLVHLLLAVLPDFARAEGAIWPPAAELAGGAPYAVAVQGDYAYLAAGVAMTVIDISLPSQPRQVGYCEMPTGARGVAVAGDYAYVVAPDGGLRVISVADPTHPVEVGYYDAYDRSALAVAVQGDYAYVAYESSLWVISVADPAHPVEVGYCVTPSNVVAVAVAGDCAYVASAGLRVISVADPAHPVEIGHRWTGDGGVAHGVAVLGDYAYMACEYGLVVISVADPADPIEVGFWHSPNPGNWGELMGVAVAGGYAYAAADRDGLWVISVADPANPVQVERHDTPGPAYAVAVAGDYAYVGATNAGLRVFWLEDPAHPVEVGDYDTPSSAYGVAMAGDYAYVSDYQWDGGLGVVSLADPAHPVQVGYSNTLHLPWWVAVEGDYAYVVDIDALWVIPLADPASPVWVGCIETLGSDARGLAVTGDYAYLPVYYTIPYPSSETISYVQVISVADPAHPVEVSRIEGGWGAVTAAGGYLYRGSLVVLSLADPANPVEVGQCVYTHRPVNAMAVVGDYAYLAGDTGLGVISVADPANPVEVGYCDTPDEAVGVAVAGRYAYVADGDAGLRVISVADPADPVEVGCYDTPGYANGVAVSQDAVCLADQGWGLLVFAPTFPDVPLDHWAFWEIQACCNAGVVRGYDDGLYRPQSSVTRDQMAVYIARALVTPTGDAAIPDPEPPPSFGDVPPTHWAHKHIEYAVSQNVVEGYEDGLYHPEYEVTRDQMAVYIARAMVAPTGDAAVADPEPPPTFPDVLPDFWAYKHVEYCVEHGVVSGYEDGLYHPEVVVTRDQMAVYIARAFRLL